MIRIAVAISQILCVLLCPYICTARAATVEREAPIACACCELIDGSHADELPADSDETPCDDACGGECVSRAIAASPAKFVLPDADVQTLCVAAQSFVASPLSSYGATSARGGLTHPELASGHAIRIRFASLLL
jgi:hypothetical protein